MCPPSRIGIPRLLAPTSNPPGACSMTALPAAATPEILEPMRYPHSAMALGCLRKRARRSALVLYVDPRAGICASGKGHDRAGASRSSVDPADPLGVDLKRRAEQEPTKNDKRWRPSDHHSKQKCLKCCHCALPGTPGLLGQAGESPLGHPFNAVREKWFPARGSSPAGLLQGPGSSTRPDVDGCMPRVSKWER
jgi:hypothetical protein